VQHSAVVAHVTLLPLQHPVAPVWVVPHWKLWTVLQVAQVTPFEPQFAVVVPALQMGSPALLVPQQPSQLVAPQALASQRQVVVLKVDPVPHVLSTHRALLPVPHSAVPIGHAHSQAAFSSRPPLHDCTHWGSVVPLGVQSTVPLLVQPGTHVPLTGCCPAGHSHWHCALRV
jgi:hypothetical protein